MNKKLVIVLTFIFVFSFALLVVAAQDFSVILDPIGEQNYSSLPQTYDVTGTVKGVENAEINWIKLYINGDLEKTFLLDNTKIGAGGYDFSLPWDIEDEGIFDVKVVAEIAENDGITRKDTERDVKITLTPEEEFSVNSNDNKDKEYSFDQATENNPAAPAVANKILKELGLKHNYGGGNYISDVAREMGPGTEFQGVAKTNEDYEDQIRSYLEDHEAWDEDAGIQDNKPGKGNGNAYGLNKEKNNDTAKNGNKKNK